MSTQPIKVFLVDDSPIVLRVLERIIGESADLELVGTAYNGEDALAKIPTAQPQVICTDLWMESVDGAELIEWTMAHCPCPILVISEDGNDPETAERLKELGAIEVMGKPQAAAKADESLDGCRPGVPRQVV